MSDRYVVEEVIGGWAVLIDERPVAIRRKRDEAAELAQLLDVVERATAPLPPVLTEH
jgi:hypothetical protein